MNERQPAYAKMVTLFQQQDKAKRGLVTMTNKLITQLEDYKHSKSGLPTDTTGICFLVEGVAGLKNCCDPINEKMDGNDDTMGGPGWTFEKEPG